MGVEPTNAILPAATPLLTYEILWTPADGSQIFFGKSAVGLEPTVARLRATLGFGLALFTMTFMFGFLAHSMIVCV